MSKYTIAQMQNLPIGTRVALPNGIDAYPHFRTTEALTGIVTEVDMDSLWFRVDGSERAELSDWSNQVQVWFFADDDGNESGIELLSLGEFLYAELDREIGLHADSEDIQRESKRVFAKYGVVPTVDIEESKDREGVTFFEVSASYADTMLANEYFYDRNEANAYASAWEA
jgi:hypothetical protein